MWGSTPQNKQKPTNVNVDVNRKPSPDLESHTVVPSVVLFKPLPNVMPKSLYNYMAVTALWWHRLWVPTVFPQAPRDKLNASFGSNVFPCVLLHFSLSWQLGTPPLNHRFRKGGEVSLPSVAKATVHGSIEVKCTHCSAYATHHMPNGSLHLGTAVIPINSVQVLIRTQGTLVPYHRYYIWRKTICLMGVLRSDR